MRCQIRACLMICGDSSECCCDVLHWNHWKSFELLGNSDCHLQMDSMNLNLHTAEGNYLCTFTYLFFHKKPVYKRWPKLELLFYIWEGIRNFSKQNFKACFAVKILISYNLQLFLSNVHCKYVFDVTEELVSSTVIFMYVTKCTHSSCKNYCTLCMVIGSKKQEKISRNLAELFMQI